MQSKTAALIATTILLLGILFALPLLLSLVPKPSPASAPPASPPAQPPQAGAPPLNASRPTPVISVPKANITNATAIAIQPQPAYNLTKMALDIHSLVNRQRLAQGLDALSYNPDIADVAQLHSNDLARENEPLTDPSLYCPRPFIHHEGFDFGLYETDRMYNRSIYYFSAAGENIFMTSAWSYMETYATPAPPPCPDNGLEIAKEYSGPDAPQQVQADYQSLLSYVKTAARVNWTKVDWSTQPDIESSIVQGWMQSPGHRANILNANYTEEGIGVAEVNGFIIVTEDFIARVDCGYEGAQCCQAADAVYCYEPWSCSSGSCS